MAVRFRHVVMPLLIRLLVLAAPAMGQATSPATTRPAVAVPEIRPPATRPASSPASAPEDPALAPLRQRMEAARAGLLAHDGGDPLKRLEASAEYKAAVSDLAAKERRVAALPASGAELKDVDWAKLAHDSARKRVERMRAIAATAPTCDEDELLAAAKARAAFLNAKDGPAYCIFGEATDAKRVVFVLDTGGSMINQMALAKVEVSKAIARLGPGQSFNLIADQGEPEAETADRHALLPGTPDGKRRGYRFLEDIVCLHRLRSDPMPPVRSALRFKPDVVYVLTDGFEYDNESRTAVAALYECARALRRDRAKLHVIFLHHGFDTLGVDALTTLARESGGVVDVVTEELLPRVR